MYTNIPYIYVHAYVCMYACMCINTVGATRLARAHSTTALARSLSNTNMEMFYKHFRLEISTD